MQVLGIETSCDETAVAIVADTKKILSQCVLSQIAEHAPFGGVVPEIAARSHIESLDKMIQHAMEEAEIRLFSDLDGIAVTAGPGLIGGVIVGVMMAKAIATAANIPIVGVNHLEGHALTARLTNDVDFPFLLLLVSGGHCQIMSVEGVGKYTCLGRTLDDAVGEAFDKTAKILGLGYPGGPIVEKYAKNGDPKRFDFPRPLIGKAGCDFSFSGLKTAVKRLVDSYPSPSLKDSDKYDICASFQSCVRDILIDRLSHAFAEYKSCYSGHKTLVVAGGVAANQYLIHHIDGFAKRHDFCVIAPPIGLCTDNAAMIAWAGLENMQLGKLDDNGFIPKARWPLETLS